MRFHYMVHIRMSCHLRREEMSKYTKTRIMDAFLYLLNEKSMDRLTVKDVIETAYSGSVVKT